jgi:hypothetical protein
MNGNQFLQVIAETFKEDNSQDFSSPEMNSKKKVEQASIQSIHNLHAC